MEGSLNVLYRYLSAKLVSIITTQWIILSAPPGHFLSMLTLCIDDCSKPFTGAEENGSLASQDKSVNRPPGFLTVLAWKSASLFLFPFYPYNI